MQTLRIKKSDMESGEARRFEVTNHPPVCVVRIADSFYAIGDTCSHENVSLSEGDRVDEDDCWIECWKHGSNFSLLDGSPEAGPATRPVPFYEVTDQGDEVIVTIL